ncbi:MAG TPA: hypothetical protein H9692_06470 [Firmicutes bacterium]|nr:hypothetical protein [Bacillota bacterium]
MGFYIALFSFPRVCDIFSLSAAPFMLAHFSRLPRSRSARQCPPSVRRLRPPLIAEFLGYRPFLFSAPFARAALFAAKLKTFSKSGKSFQFH